MAYVSGEKKKELAPGIKAVLKKYGVVGTIAVDHKAVLKVNLRRGPFDLNGSSLNYQIEKFEGVVKEFLTELKDAMMIGNHDRSDIMTDYFDVGWYIDINAQNYTIEA